MSTASGAALYVLLLGGKSDLPRRDMKKISLNQRAASRRLLMHGFSRAIPAMYRRNARSRLNIYARLVLFFFSNNSRRRELSSVSNISSFTGTAGIMRRDEKHRPARVHDGSCYAVIFIWGLMGDVAVCTRIALRYRSYRRTMRAICIIPFAVR